MMGFGFRWRERNGNGNGRTRAQSNDDGGMGDTIIITDKCHSKHTHKRTLTNAHHAYSVD